MKQYIPPEIKEIKQNQRHQINRSKQNNNNNKLWKADAQEGWKEVRNDVEMQGWAGCAHCY